MSEAFTVLEIGSGSFKLHKNNAFSIRVQSSLGKNLKGNQLDPAAVATATLNLEQEIIPFLEEHGIKPAEVVVFATAAIRRSMLDPKGSGKKFLDQVLSMGFSDIKVFTEKEECYYAARGVLQEIGDLHDHFLMLDSGGASHQLVEFKDGEIVRSNSYPIGSHSKVAKMQMPNFLDQGYTPSLPIAVIGTTGLIINHIVNINIMTLKEMVKAMDDQSIEERRDFLKAMSSDDFIHELFVDFRLQVLPNAFRIIHNCCDNLRISKFVLCTSQAMDYISAHGFDN